ncbi:2-C-methyl-D-erythritol 4-phosphate cytidylyltransferase [Halosquirtibacter laminarini]|uniref:2-C-methyl-D-erythritol 4-phosphate cytidylyltransferase n=1 Tax=Halosquirtibacter laminarini TaxID=3374600 RepID=A0AC61NIF3_9BACT|nr:2-C-methyl-D-erythritol 4-phosphate cytidylyltransferase [Prolixibacteraceae bacterium]
MERTVIIVAGGSGTRMGAEIPKQFLRIKERSILEHTIKKFYSFDDQIEMIIVLPKDQISRWKDYCIENYLSIPHIVAEGGETRFHSVLNGLNVVTKKGVIAIHDGVRPCVSHNTLNNCFNHVEDNGAVIPVVELVDSIREIKNTTSNAVDRSKYRLVQTPQTFLWEVIWSAYQQDYSPLFTDDASVVEQNGHKISLVPGNRENIKVTTKEDLKWIEPFLK